jgi:bud site selection protein 20
MDVHPFFRPFRLPISCKIKHLISARKVLPSPDQELEGPRNSNPDQPGRHSDSPQTQEQKIFAPTRTAVDEMGQPQGKKRKRHTNGNHPLHRTRAYGRDVDQIAGDISEKARTLALNTALDEDKPGMGVHYCLECARWFVDETTLSKHRGSKVHKRRYELHSPSLSFSLFSLGSGAHQGRLKQLDEGAFTQKEAEAAIGLSTDKGEVKQSMDSR